MKYLLYFSEQKIALALEEMSKNIDDRKTFEKIKINLKSEVNLINCC